MSLTPIYDESIKVDPTHVLPVEIIQQILSHLPPASYVAAKFVSRAFHHSTVLPSGRDLRSFKSMSNLERHEYINGIIALEAAHMREPLKLLTCRWCGRRKDNSANEFCDDQFVQTMLRRACLKCQWRPFCHIKGVLLGCCHVCGRYMDNSIDGFSDEEFDHTVSDPGCLKCHRIHFCHIKGVSYTCCYACNQYVEGLEDEKGMWTPRQVHVCEESK